MSNEISADAKKFALAGAGAPTGTLESFKFAFSSPARFRTELLAALTVALLLIPESIAFSVVAGVDPKVGLVSSVMMIITMSIAGGRPAMVTAATAGVALVVAPLSKEYGLTYLIACVILAGIIQLILGAVGIAKLLRFIPRSVMIGFSNSLGITLFISQLEHLTNVPWQVYVLAAVTLFIVYLWPRITRVIPAALIAIFSLTAVSHWSGINVPTVGNMGALPTRMPRISELDQIPLTLETLQIIWPYAVSMAIVGLMQNLMTAKIVDSWTDSFSNKNREAIAVGLANIVSGVFGGMGGSAMIGQTGVNVRDSRARTRLSTLLSGIFLTILLLVFGGFVSVIPMAVVAGVMIQIAISTVNWHSLSPKTLRKMPKSENITMLVTVIGSLVSGNFAVGVILGVLTAMIRFATRLSHLASVNKIGLETQEDETGTRTVSKYEITGPLFWASSNDLVYQFDYTDQADHIIIDVSRGDIWDATAVSALDSVVLKYTQRGRSVHVTGLEASGHGFSKEWVHKLTEVLESTGKAAAQAPRIYP